VIRATDIKAVLYITDARAVFCCEKYDKGGMWTGVGYGAVIAIGATIVSKTRAAYRRKGKMLAGHMRYSWLSHVGGYTQSGYSHKERLRMVARDGLRPSRPLVIVDFVLPKTSDSIEIAQEIVRRAAQYRLEHDRTLSDEHRSAFEHLTFAPRKESSRNGFGMHSMPRFWPVGEGLPDARETSPDNGVEALPVDEAFGNNDQSGVADRSTVLRGAEVMSVDTEYLDKLLAEDGYSVDVQDLFVATASNDLPKPTRRLLKVPLETLHVHLGPKEILQGLADASSGKLRGLLATTNERLLFLDRVTGLVEVEIPLHELTATIGSDNSLLVQTSDFVVRFVHLSPTSLSEHDEADAPTGNGHDTSPVPPLRICADCGAEFTPLLLSKSCPDCGGDLVSAP
jgi:hypothetical protein